MKFVIRYGLAALLIITAIVLVIPPFAASLIEQWSESDVESRSVLAFNSALGQFNELLVDRDLKKIMVLFERMALDEQLLAVGFATTMGRSSTRPKKCRRASFARSRFRALRRNFQHFTSAA